MNSQGTRKLDIGAIGGLADRKAALYNTLAIIAVEATGRFLVGLRPDRGVPQQGNKARKCPKSMRNQIVSEKAPSYVSIDLDLGARICQTPPPNLTVFDIAMVPMTSSSPRQFGNRLLRHLVPWSVLVLCLSLTGCANDALRGGSFLEDDWSTMPQSMRSSEDQGMPTAYSNKAKQIERNLGIQ